MIINISLRLNEEHVYTITYVTERRNKNSNKQLTSRISSKWTRKQPLVNKLHDYILLIWIILIFPTDTYFHINNIAINHTRFN